MQFKLSRIKPNRPQTFGHHISTGIYGNNPPFTTPPKTQVVFDGIISDYHLAYEAYKNGGKDQKGAYVITRTNFMSALDEAAVYVDGIVGVDEGMIMLAGFVPTKTSESKAVIPDTSDSVVYYQQLYFVNADNKPSYNDLLIYVPADSLSYRVTNFTYTQVKCKRCPKMILYDLVSCYVNGVKDTTPLFSWQSYGGVISINK